MNTNRDASSYTARLAARAVLQDRIARDEAIKLGAISVSKAVTYDYSVLVPANKVQAFEPIAPWLYTSQPETNEPEEPQQEIYGYPANAPQTDKSLPSLTYTYEEGTYKITASSQLNTAHALVHLFNDNINDLWACFTNEYRTTKYDGLDYSGCWIRVELPFAIIATGVRLSARQGNYVDQRPKDFRVYGTNDDIGEESWTLLYNSSGVNWPYSGGATADQTKEFSFSTNNAAYKNFLIVMNSNYYSESTLADKDIHILQFISLTEYKILGYPAPAPAIIESDANLGAPTIVYALPDDSAAYIYFNPPSTGTPINYMYSINNGTTYTAISPTSISSPIKITNLVNGTAYQIKLKALSVIGEGTESQAISATPVSASSALPWLYFDPANTTSYSGTGNSVVNIGSYNSSILTGTKAAAVSYINGTGLSRKVFDFNGANGSVISFPQFDFGTAITVCAWIHPRDKANINGLLANAPANVNPSGFKFQWNWWNNGSRAISFQAGNGITGNDDYSPAATIQYNEWQHIAYVFDQANRKILFFWNGIPTTMGSDAIPVENIGMNQAFNIGGYIGGSYTMNAQLGYIKVFDSLLSASDVYTEYNASKNTFLPPS
jgi:hypothetical protein